MPPSPEAPRPPSPVDIALSIDPNERVGVVAPLMDRLAARFDERAASDLGRRALSGVQLASKAETDATEMAGRDFETTRVMDWQRKRWLKAIDREDGMIDRQRQRQKTMGPNIGIETTPGMLGIQSIRVVGPLIRRYSASGRARRQAGSEHAGDLSSSDPTVARGGVARSGAGVVSLKPGDGYRWTGDSKRLVTPRLGSVNDSAILNPLYARRGPDGEQQAPTTWFPDGPQKPFMESALPTKEEQAKGTTPAGEAYRRKATKQEDSFLATRDKTVAKLQKNALKLRTKAALNIAAVPNRQARAHFNRQRADRLAEIRAEQVQERKAARAVKKEERKQRRAAEKVAEPNMIKRNLKRAKRAVTRKPSTP